MVTSLVLVLAVPKVAHRHYGGQAIHFHTVLPSSEIDANHKPIVDFKQIGLGNDPLATSDQDFSGDLEFSSSNGDQSYKDDLAHWRQMDVSLDELRDEVVFGELERQAASPPQFANGDSVASSATHKVPTHDESIPHVHFVLLGLEFTMNLPSSRQVTVENVQLTSDPKVIQILPSNEFTIEKSLVKGEVLSGSTSVKVKVTFPHWLHSYATLSSSSRPPFVFEQPQDQHAQSVDQQVDSPPPRLS